MPWGWGRLANHRRSNPSPKPYIKRPRLNCSGHSVSHSLAYHKCFALSSQQLSFLLRPTSTATHLYPISPALTMKPTGTVKVNRFAKRCVTPAMAARKALLRRVQRQEIRRLQSLVPRLSNLPHRQVDEVTVIEEAVRFIDQLHRTLLARIANGTIAPATLQGVNVAELQRLQSGRHMAAPISSRPLINGPNRKSY